MDFTSVKVLIPTVVAVASVGGGGWVGGVKAIEFLDSRYAPLQAVEDLAYSQLKKDMRELRDRIEAASGQLKEDLEADLESLIDRLCRSYPEDRECRRD